MHGGLLYRGAAMPWILAFHIIAFVAWFAGLFYLPRLFVYHALATDTISLDRFKQMERKLYYFIMLPAATLTLGLGVWLLALNFHNYIAQGWMQAKLVFVSLLIVYHLYCGKVLKDFKNNRNRFSSKFFRWFNEIPTLLLIAIVILVVVRP